MNFQFMIYILLGLMLYFYFVLKVKSTVYFIILLIILVLNEIYNFKNYNRKDLFSSGAGDDSYNYNLEYKRNYEFDKTLNPIEYARNEFKSVKIPNVFEGDTHLRDGIVCSVQKTILDEKLKSKKLDYQEAYTDALSDMIFPQSNDGDNSLQKIIEGEKVNLSFEDDLDPNVFNPIFSNNFTESKKCPTVCHLISDYNKCKNTTDIPTFQNKSEFDDWRVNTLDRCANIRNEAQCNRSDVCSYDTRFNKCYYDKRKCLAYRDSEGTQCHTRCEYLNVPNNIEKSKMNCDSAKLFNNDAYCEWNTLRKECAPKCNMFSGENECNSSRYCEYQNGRCINS